MVVGRAARKLMKIFVGKTSDGMRILQRKVIYLEP